MKTPTITIVTACLNSEKNISKSFDSLLNQEYANIEYFVIDGCSTDSTIEIIKEYEAKFIALGCKFKWISERDDGIYDAMNKGIEMSTGEIIGILNSDDFYEPHALSSVVEAYIKNPHIGIFYGFLRVLHNGNELEIYRYNYDYYLTNLTTGVLSAAQHPTCFVNKKVYQKIGGFDLQFRTASDHDFLIRAKLAGIKFFPLDQVLANFELGGESNTLTEYERFEQRSRILYKNGLITEKIRRKDLNYLKYSRYKNFKKKYAKMIFKI